MINCVTDSAVGGTFLSWSLHYLAGHNQYYLRESNSWVNLVQDPLSSKNAHKFIPNQPNRIINCSPEQFQTFTSDLKSTPTNLFHVLYFHPFSDDNTTQAAFKYINNNKEKLVVVDSSDTPLYHCSYRKRGPLADSGKLLHSNSEIHEYFVKKYFSGSADIWNKLNLTEVWDHREFLALNTRPFLVDQVYKSINKSKDHFVIKGSELWSSFTFTLDNLLNYCEISIDKQRLPQWQETYNMWRQQHHQRLLFSAYFETIINSILNNYSLDLLRFDLDIEQEAAIQHALIYRHNLNLKTWQLEKFTNTKQLHNLLEPNTHSLSS